MTPTPKQILTALFTLVFVAGFTVNSHHVYFAVALCVVIYIMGAMIVFVGGSDSGGGAAETKTKERKDSEVNNL